jgi:DNA-binding response OmpR family regulator
VNRVLEGELRILLVEDEPSAATMLAKGLREEAYAVDLAADGETAQAQAFVNDYDLIILDIVLPGKDGFRVCRELRANGLTAPVLMLTARDAVEDRVEDLTPELTTIYPSHSTSRNY